MWIYSISNNFFFLVSKTLCVTGISEDMDKNTVMNNFDGALDVRIIKDFETGKNKGYYAVDILVQVYSCLE